MPSSYTTQNRLELQAPGENLNAWGSKLNADTIALIDFAISGATALTVSAPVTLTTANGAADQGRSAILNCTGTGGTVTIPAVSHVYQVRNACSGGLVFTTGSGTTATVEAGSSATVISDGTNCYRFADAADIATCLAAAEAYTDAAAFSSAAGNLPGQTGNAGKFLQTDGTTPHWLPISSGNVTSALGFTPQAALGFTPLNKASNLSDIASPSAALSNLGGVSTTYLSVNYTTTTALSAALALLAPLNSPGLTGNPTAPTPATNDNDTSIATTAFVQTAVATASPLVTRAIFRNVQANGVGSGETLTATAWTQRVLNNTATNTIAGATLGSNQISLPAGTYEVSAEAQASEAASISGTNAVYNHRLRLVNVTDSATIFVGPNTAAFVSGTTVSAALNADFQGVFTLAGTKSIRIDSWVNGVSNSNGGVASSSGENEIYVTIYLRKVA